MKFHLSFFWIFFLVLAYFSNVLRTYLIIFLMLFIHEMGHIIVAKYYKYEVSEITIFPFGFYSRISNLDYASSFELFMMMLGGLMMHFFFYIFLIFLYKFDNISISYYEYLQNINLSILMFNIIPIYPLDGGRCMFSIVRMFFNYKISKMIIYFISFIIIIYLFVYANISFRIVLILLFIINIKDILNLDYQRVEYLYYKEKDFNVKKNNV